MVKYLRFTIIALLLVVMISSCKDNSKSKSVYTAELKKSDLYLKTVKQLTDVIVHDIFSPPVASRVYVYPSIAAYEAILPAYPSRISFANQLNGLTPLDIDVDTSKVSFELASILAFSQVGKALIFSEATMDTYEQEFLGIVDSIGVPESVVNASKIYASKVADHILKWAKSDNYAETRSMSKFTITDEASEWKPTPPAYMQGIEPHWNQIRPMVLDSANQYKPLTPPPFDLDKSSGFFSLVMEVYDVGNNLTDDQKAIASFWDCNPYVMNQTGHVMYATKKITPGGHWMGITGVACRKVNADLIKSLEAHALVSISLFDGFISCWDEKYRSKLIRPETLINEYIDPNWVPALQTPPFPEYTSGHSVISTAAAMALTSVFGDDFEFSDDVELEYGLPIRRFDSFLKASSEAAISRLYGGIHYMPAITNGVEQGEQISKLILSRLETKQ